ncbi:MAG: YecR family lipoprotein [Alphaproteobacteria bacterium]|nr:YecR family lipoprotein [Alphaproteobacteria bacterium]
MKKFIILAIACLSLSSCFQAHTETFLMDGGDSKVYLGYHQKTTEEVNINWKNAKAKAIKYCRHELDYNDAEKFGKPKQECIEENSTDGVSYCVKYEVSVPYKCLIKNATTEEMYK